MTFVYELHFAWQICTLNTAYIKRVKNLKLALVIIAIAGLFSGIASYLQAAYFPVDIPKIFSFINTSPKLSSILFAPIFSIAGTCIVFGIYHGLAKLLGGKASYTEFFKPAGYASIIKWVLLVGFIPYLGIALNIIISIWTIIIYILIVKKVYNLSTKKSAIVILLPALIFFILILLLMILATGIFNA